MLGRVLAIALGGVGLLVGLMLFAVLQAGAQTPVGPPTQQARDDIPAPLLALYQQAVQEHCPTLPWSVLAAVGKVESNHARTGGAQLQPDGTTVPAIIGPALDGSPGLQHIADTDHGLWDGDLRWDRAVGPLQFLPTIWASTGIDADGDGVANPHDIDDAIPAAAAKLCANGAGDPSRLRQAIWTYNHSWDYVDQVMAHAARYASFVPAASADPVLIAAVLDNPNIDIYAAGRDDIAAGRIDNRILAILAQAAQRWHIGVSSLQTGHSTCVGGGDHAGCNVSNHYYGRAVDIHRVNSQPVTAANRDAYELAAWLDTLAPVLRPDSIGTPWADLSDLLGYFTDLAHHDHIHIGLDANL